MPHKILRVRSGAQPRAHFPVQPTAAKDESSAVQSQLGAWCYSWESQISLFPLLANQKLPNAKHPEAVGTNAQAFELPKGALLVASAHVLVQVIRLSNVYEHRKETSGWRQGVTILSSSPLIQGEVEKFRGKWMMPLNRRRELPAWRFVSVSSLVTWVHRKPRISFVLVSSFVKNALSRAWKEPRGTESLVDLDKLWFWGPDRRQASRG
jgi:hypothetical protein